MLNPQSPVPLYRQLADLLLARIRSGEYPPESKIPSEHLLARTFALGRPTVRQATEVLVRRGILARRRGAGTFVTAPKKEVDLFSFGGTMASFEKEGISLSTRILSKTRLKRIAPDPENPFAGQNAYFVSRLGRVEKTPVLIEDIYLHPGLFAGIDGFDLRGRSLSRIAAEHYYLRPSGGRQTFKIDHLPEKKSRMLAVSPDTPILAVKRYLHFAKAQNAVFSKLYCRTDHFVFSQTIGGQVDEEQGLL